jgi:hypothetical protein
MSPTPTMIAVQDANVLIDMELAGLFDLWFQTGIETHTTDFIRAELENGGHAQALAYFENGQVREHRLTFEEIMAVSDLEREIGSKAKFNDCSVLFLALKLDAMLLSGDKPLRKAGKERQIEVHGTLWIFDQLVEMKLLPAGSAAAKLEHLRGLDRFFPEVECHARLTRWHGA